MAVTLPRWKYFKRHEPIDGRERALACLFLNRTSFSGILAPRAGPIGGHAGESKYPIDCRFPRTTLVRRIRQAGGCRRSSPQASLQVPRYALHVAALAITRETRK